MTMMLFQKAELNMMLKLKDVHLRQNHIMIALLQTLTLSKSAIGTYLLE